MPEEGELLIEIRYVHGYGVYEARLLRTGEIVSSHHLHTLLHELEKRERKGELA